MALNYSGKYSSHGGSGEEGGNIVLVSGRDLGCRSGLQIRNVDGYRLMLRRLA
jgi:hypothetical protein